MFNSTELHALEARRHFDGASFATLTSRGTLIVVGDGAANQITVAFDDASGTAIATRDGQSQSFAALSVQRIRVEAMGGNDRVTVSGPRSCTILGGSGNDTLNSGRRDDSLDGGAGDDMMDGGAGDDFIGGGDGFDTADYFSRDVGFYLALDRDYFDEPQESFGESTARCEPLNETDKIGYFVEAVGGTSMRDTLFAGSGFDTIIPNPSVMDGRGGNDSFTSNEARTIFQGGAGNDVFELYEGSGAVTIFGGPGDDLIAGSEDHWLPSALEGGSGRDTIAIDAAITDILEVDMREYPGVEDLVVGSFGFDRAVLIGNDLNNHITAGYPEYGEGPPVAIYGLAGNDTLEGGGNADALYGGDGDDLMTGALGDDTLRGEDGNDVLGGDDGADLLLGHAGSDNLNGGNGNDRLDGGAGRDTCYGAAGDERIYARDGDLDTVNGGAGMDAAEIDDEIDLLFGLDVWLTDEGTLSMLGDSAANEMTIAFDDQAALAVATRDGKSQTFPILAVRRAVVDAGKGADRVTILIPRPSTIIGGTGNDTLTGGRGDDSLDGGFGDDVLDGWSGSDFLGGGDGFDTADYSSRAGEFFFRFDIADDEGNIPPGPFDEHTRYGRAFAGDEEDTIGYFVEAVIGTEDRDSFGVGEVGDIPRDFDGRGGSDGLSASGNSPQSRVTLRGGDGADAMSMSGSLRASMFAGPGDDLISLSALPDVLEGGPGYERIELATFTGALLDLRQYPDVEEAFHAGFKAPVTVIGNDLPNFITATRDGGAVRPSAFAVTLQGMGGDDTLEGGNADDSLSGGDGNDALTGGFGNDTLGGDGGNDVLGGDGGNDVLLGHDGDDNLNGSAGNDRLDGGAGTDIFNGGSGNDRLFARDMTGETVNAGTGFDSAESDDLDALFSVETVLP